MNIVECKPQDAICVVEADLKVDFKPPLDYVEPKYIPRAPKAEEKEELKYQEGIKQVDSFNTKFPGKGARLDGKSITKKQQLSLISEFMEEQEKPYDPRQFRLEKGIVSLFIYIYIYLYLYIYIYISTNL